MNKPTSIWHQFVKEINKELKHKRMLKEDYTEMFDNSDFYRSLNAEIKGMKIASEIARKYFKP